MDWHCVTGWSTLGLRFKGVRMADFIELVKPQENWVCLWQAAVLCVCEACRTAPPSADVISSNGGTTGQLSAEVTMALMKRPTNK
ncbi:hypothetical protein BSKO_09524 [Bryopsis sp. KO-2023]|nr:hypothetical protein BSKO_09524 [Bryopsis sp. KO-2023]